MSASTYSGGGGGEVTESTRTCLLPLLRTWRRGKRAELRLQLPIVREMLAAMEAQTVAGHRYTMEKVVGCLRQKVVFAGLNASPRNKRAVSQLIDQLAREANRRLPDVRSFSDRTETLVALLIAASELP
jgi:hypothetical protein